MFTQFQKTVHSSLMEKFGGAWSDKKLQALKRYLDASTLAMKNQPFKVAYIDAFAGAGFREFPESPPRSPGSITNFRHHGPR